MSSGYIQRLEGPTNHSTGLLPNGNTNNNAASLEGFLIDEPSMKQQQLSESTFEDLKSLVYHKPRTNANTSLFTTPHQAAEPLSGTASNIYPSSKMSQLNGTKPVFMSGQSPTVASTSPTFQALSETDKAFITPLSNILPSVKSPHQTTSQTSTALATRTTEAVIADLKRTQNGLRANNSKPIWGSRTTKSDENNNSIENWRLVVQNSADGAHYGGENQEEYDEEEEEEEEIVAVTKPKRISERRRRNLAVADNYIQASLQQSIKDGISSFKPGDEANQPARWLINQSVSQQIILTPRAYQTELFERAKETNVIAVLDTGLGKTLIAVLLLRYIFAQELEYRAMGKPKRISFFLVDSVTLLFQQHAVLKANLDQPMNFFCGDMGCDLWSRDNWEKHFNENMVIVCTAEVLRNCLARAFIRIDQINLLIFDEAHHAKKDHPYARIIMDHYAVAPLHIKLPRIFGMTASPVDARTDVRKAAKELETILHSQIITSEDGTLGGYKPNSKQEHLARYAVLNPPSRTKLYQEMHERFKTNSVMKKPLSFAFEATRDLGLWCSDQVWQLCLDEEGTKKLLANTERHYHGKKVLEPLHVLESRKAQLLEARDMIKSHKYEDPDFKDDSLYSSNLSSKVVLLVGYLRERFERPTDDKAIVFVKQRYTARLLARLFSFGHIRTPYLKVGTLVGTRSGSAGDLTTSFRDQVITMMNFRKGIINCIFATSVAEEGLDIPDCNLIIRFDLYATLIQFIQSRGRARQRNSRYIHMYETGNNEHMSIIREVKQNEKSLQKFCQALPDDRKISGKEVNIDYFLAKEKANRTYTVPETGAKLTYKMSLTVLASFVDSLPHGPDQMLQADYIVLPQNKQFICEVILPEASPVRGAVGRPASTKAVARCSAAFEACLLLRRGNYIDKHLLPVFTKQLPAMRNALLAVDSKKREAYNMRTKPEMWSVGGIPAELFLTVLNLERTDCLDRPSQPLALLTRTTLPQLPSFVLHFGGGRHSPVHITPLANSLRVDALVLRQLNTFTLCIFEDVFSKGYEPDEAKMPYFLAPVKSRAEINKDSDPLETIDWEILEAIDDHQTKWGDQHWENKSWRHLPDELLKDKFVIDPFDGSRKLWTVGVDKARKALDPVPPEAAPRKGARKNNDNILEYSCSLWAKARSRRAFDEKQRVVEAQLISLRRNLLDQFDASEVETPQTCWIVLEPLKISPLPTTVVATAYLFPAVIHRVESYLIALDGCSLLHLEVRPDLALEAFTKDSDNSGEHGEQQINFQRGMGNNYERLEFLGDCFLKMATSISLYGTRPENNEYAYHVDRMLLICNKNLRNNAVNLKLYEYIRSYGFNRRAWYPEGLVLRKGKTAKAPDSQKLGDKTIADVCEALIGAALLSTPGMDNAVRAVTELVSSENHQLTSYSEYYKLYTMPKYQTSPATAAHRWLADEVAKKHDYSFKYPRLLRSAFIHPSYPYSYEKIPSYQRLEFLGDALFDMVCINYLFHMFPDRDPQWLTEHKMAMVSNQFLGALCVNLDFQQHLLIFNSIFQQQIADYVTEVQEARLQAEEEAIRAGKSKDECLTDYWTACRQPPKCLPDVIEAYIGAIFVDSEYDYSQVERFFNQHVKWFFKDMSIYDSYANKHPTTFLTSFLQVNMGCGEWDLVSKEIPSIDGNKPQVTYLVIVHEQVVASHTGESGRYSKVNAAKKAVAILEGLPLPEFREKYGCACRLEIEESDEGHDQV